MRNRRKTKIICTIGPSCDSEETIEEMIKAGMNIARINCSHGTPGDHKKVIDLIKKVREKLESPTAIMIDTKGPEIRLGDFSKTVEVKEGDTYTLVSKKVNGDKKQASVTFPDLFKSLKEGDRVLINDGLVEMVVEDVKSTKAECKVVTGGKLMSHKAINFPGREIKMPYISDKDKKDIVFGAENGVDYIACSFVSKGKDLEQVQKLIGSAGKSDIGLIAKIENQEGIDNLGEICKIADGVMVARGDLGVEVDFNNLPSVQKAIINQCRYYGKPVIVATEMLETMSYNERPTRAEVGDLANAVYDGAAAVMLSAETAMGKHPVKVVRTMHSIVKASENSAAFKAAKTNVDHVTQNKNVDALAHSACVMAHDIGAEGIICFTEGGYTANYIANFKPTADTVAVTNSKTSYYKMALYWGVHPFYQDFHDDVYEVMYNTKQFCKDWLKLKKGDEVIEIVGWARIARGANNMVQIVKI